MTDMTASTKRIRGRRAVDIRRQYLRLHPLCARCMASGRVREATEVDHILPLFKGGADTHDNRQGLCRECHAEKTDADLSRRAAGADLTGWPTDPRHPWNGSSEP